MLLVKLISNKNTMYSAMSMAANLLLPLAAIPFLSRALGGEVFGEFAIAQAAALIVCQLVDFGFSLSGAREVAGEHEHSEISAIYSKYQNTRCFLFLVALVFVSILLPFKLIPVPIILLMATIYSSALGVLLQANWFFQGRALYGWLALANFTGKLAYFLIVVGFVKNPDDVALAGFAFGFGYLVSGIVLTFAMLSLNVKYVFKLNLSEIFKTIKNGLSNFLSLALLSVHIQLVIILTGHFVSVKASGMLSIADKMVRGLSALAIPIANTAFPILSNLFAKNVQEAKKLRLKVAKILILYSLICCLMIFVFGPYIGEYLFKINDSNFGELIKIASILPVFISIGVLNGGLTLIPAGFNFEYLISIVVGEVFALVAFFSSLYIAPEYSGVIAVVVAEGVMAAMFYLFARVGLSSMDDKAGL